MIDPLRDWLHQQTGSVFFVKWPSESFITAFALESGKGGAHALYWAAATGVVKGQYSINTSKTFDIQLPTNPIVSQLTLKTALESAKAHHLALVAKAKAAISDGIAEKIVVAREEQYYIEKFDAHTFYMRLCKKYPTATVYWFLDRENNETWLGATPELLLRSTNKKIETVSLAGTRQAGTQGKWGDKEQREQRVVTDFITNKLESIGCKDVQSTVPTTNTAGPIEHLKSTITASPPKDLSLLTIAQQLHPTPAVSGLPQANAIGFIQQEENFDRDAYAGFFGMENTLNNEGVFYVNLRCLRAKEKELTLFAGGGINSASDPESEWQETVAKLSTLKTVL
ncbi:MAG: chorismate-binding protein [Schleiferiaceae bacterium]|nr:chorismate-binding protein [Schleiferiaceae bacterium]